MPQTRKTVGKLDRMQHLVLQSADLGGVAIRVAMWLVLRGDERGESFRSAATIAEDLGVCVRTVERALAKLEKANLLADRGRSHRRSMVRAVCPNAVPGELTGVGESQHRSVDRYATGEMTGHDTGQTVGAAGASPVDSSVGDRRDDRSDPGQSAGQVHSGVHSENTPPHGDRSTHEVGGSSSHAPKGEELRSDDQIREVEDRIAADVLAFLERVEMSDIGDLPHRFALEYGRGVEGWGSHTDVLDALLARAKEKASASPCGLLRSWLRSRQRWAQELLDIRGDRRHRELRQRNRIPVEDV